MILHTDVLSEIDHFQPNAKVWIYMSDRNFTDDEVEQIQKRIDLFVHEWKSHGQGILAYGRLIYNQILIFIVDESKSTVSGCSIDSSVRFVKEISTFYKVDFFKRNLTYIDDNAIKIKELEEVKNLNTNVLVINPFFKDLEEFRSSFLVPIEQSKYAKVY